MVWIQMESPANQTSITEGCVKFSPDFEVLENFEVYEERGERREEGGGGGQN